MLKFDSLEPGHKVIYIPELSYKKPINAFFLYKTESYDSSESYPKVIITINSEYISMLPTIKELRAYYQEHPDFEGNSEIHFVYNLNELKEYSKYNLDKFTKLHRFLHKHEPLFIKTKKWFYFYSDDSPSLLYTSFYKYLIAFPYFIRCRFIFRMLLYCLVGFLKYIFYYPSLFIFDLLILTFSQYKKYRESIYKFNQYNSKTYESHFLRLTIGEKTFQEEKTKTKDELEIVKKEYLNSNIAFLTLIIAIGGLVITQLYNHIEVSEVKKHNAQLVKELDKKDKEIITINALRAEIALKELRLKMIETDNSHLTTEAFLLKNQIDSFNAIEKAQKK